MLRKIFKTGNSSVVSLPREMLEQLGLREGADVSVEMDRVRGQIIIRRATPGLAGVDEGFAEQLNQFIDEYRSALEALAR